MQLNSLNSAHLWTGTRQVAMDQLDCVQIQKGYLGPTGFRTCQTDSFQVLLSGRIITCSGKQRIATGYVANITHTRRECINHWIPRQYANFHSEDQCPIFPILNDGTKQHWWKQSSMDSINSLHRLIWCLTLLVRHLLYLVYYKYYLTFRMLRLIATNIINACCAHYFRATAATSELINPW